MAKQVHTQIDEDFMKEIISQGLPMKRETPPKVESLEIQSEPETKQDIPAVEPAPQAEIHQPKERKRKSVPDDYRETYFQKMELPDRQPIYVSRSTHEKLMKIVATIGGRKATVSSYVETIILRHFDRYQDEINGLYKQTFNDLI